jgi:hypothetical protein
LMLARSERRLPRRSLKGEGGPANWPMRISPLLFSPDNSPVTGKNRETGFLDGNTELDRLRYP